MNQTTELCVIGLGYVGLPTAALFADAGVKVVGVDTDPNRLAAIEQGHCPIEEPGLPALVAKVTREGFLRVAKSPEPAHAFLLAVGTPLDESHRPYLGNVVAAAEAVGRVLKAGSLVVVESTVPPGTTRGLVRETLERASGLRAGVDFHLCHCPERALPGSALREMVANDRLVGGYDAASAAVAARLYARMVRGEIHQVDSLTSEIVKLAENTYRDVNIAYANELANLCGAVGANAAEVVRLANKHPRVHIHAPGPGVGGHCIPVVPWFLVAARPHDTPLIQAARAINDAQFDRVAAACARMLGDAKGKRVAVLGVAYKPGIDDARETPAAPICAKLEAMGCEVRASDPHVRRFERPVVGVDAAIEGADLLLFLNDETAYKSLDPTQLASRVRSRKVYDARGFLPRERWAAAGFEVETLGIGGAV